KNGGIKVYDINNNLVLFVDDKSKKLIMSGFTLDTNGLSSTYVETIPNYVQADYLKIREYIMGNITLTKEEIEYLDINHDGYISAVDYTMMRNLIDFGMFTHTWVHKFKISANNPTRFIEYSCDRGNGYVQNSEVSINSISKEAFKTINSRITDIENKLIQHGW
ncbi:MAG: dockerin type I repeat-containing protein, partial [Erysipelotrichaceae bacterium]